MAIIGNIPLSITVAQAFAAISVPAVVALLRLKRHCCSCSVAGREAAESRMQMPTSNVKTKKGITFDHKKNTTNSFFEMYGTLWNIDIIDEQHVMGRLVGHHFTTKNKKPNHRNHHRWVIALNVTSWYIYIYIYVCMYTLYIIIRYKFILCGGTVT